jgi:acetoin utilization protein AcuC
MCKIIYSPEYKKYDLGAGHPFDPRRVEMMLDLLKEYGLSIETLEPEPVKPDELLPIHDETFIQIIEAVSRGEKILNLEEYGLGTLDNPVAIGMAEGARFQVGGTLLGARLLLQNKAKKILQLGGGFHHARFNKAEGFCIYNDLALAINEMIKTGWHVLYLDIDAHHGDGVQEIFYSDENVMTISLHESGEYLFPGTGWIHELGKGMGRGLKLNLPLEPFTEGDSFIEVFEGIVPKALSWFKPDAIIVQAGVDAHYSDALADLMLTSFDFQKIFTRIIELADKFSNGKILFTLGGGYSFTAAPRIWTILLFTLFNLNIPNFLPLSWINRWKQKANLKIPSSLHDLLPAYDLIPRKLEIEKYNRALIQRLLDAVSPYWL